MHCPVNARFVLVQHRFDVSAGGPVVGPVVAVDDRSPNNPVVDAAACAIDAAPCLPTLWEAVPFTAEPSPCASLTNVHLLAVVSHVVGGAQHVSFEQPDDMLVLESVGFFLCLPPWP